MKIMSRYTIAVCAIVGFASATSASATTIGVSAFSPQFVGVDLSTATILSDADSNVVNTSVAFTEVIGLTARGGGLGRGGSEASDLWLGRRRGLASDYEHQHGDNLSRRVDPDRSEQHLQ